MNLLTKSALLIAFSSTLGMSNVVLAEGDHSHSNEHSSHTSMSTKNEAMFLQKESIDGYDVSFHVMKATPGKEMGGSHDFMIKVEKNGKTINNVVMNTKVIYPDGKSESKATMLMGDWLMAGYDLKNSGKHQLMILFKTSDGVKHKGGVYYEGR